MNGLADCPLKIAEPFMNRDLPETLAAEIREFWSRNAKEDRCAMFCQPTIEDDGAVILRLILFNADQARMIKAAIKTAREVAND